MFTYELLAQDGSTVHVHRNHLIPYYPKEPLLYPHLRNFMRFQTQLNSKFHKLPDIQTAILLLLIQTNPCLKKILKHL